MPTRIGKYDILRRLGQGAMGEVFLAKDPLIGREVAIKTIAPGQAQGEEARERFLREARAAGQLSHPNLVTIHEFGEDQGLLYLVMEYVPGEDLFGLMAIRALQPREVLAGPGAGLRRPGLCPRQGRAAPGHQAQQHPGGPAGGACR